MDGNKIIRRRKAHTRSRAGCLGCRQRHKRCDEDFTDGSCGRCRHGGLKCIQSRANKQLAHEPQITEQPPRQESIANYTLALDVQHDDATIEPHPSPVGATTSGSADPLCEALFSSAPGPSLTSSTGNIASGQSVLDLMMSLSNTTDSFDFGFLLPPADGEVVQSSHAPADGEVIQGFQALDTSELTLDFPPSDPPASVTPVPTFSEPGSTHVTSRVTIPDSLLHDPDMSAAFIVALGYESKPEESGSPSEVTQCLGSKDDAALLSNGWENIAQGYQDYQRSWRKKSDEIVISFTSQQQDPPNPLLPTTHGAVVEALKTRAGHRRQSAMGTVYHDFALSLLREPGCVSLPDALHAVCDLQAYNFLLGGAAPCYKALEVAELLVHATLGPNPVLDLDLAVRKQEMSLIMFAEGNLGLCLCTRRRKPMFALSTRDILDAHRRFYGNVIKDRTYVVPLPVHEVFHRICNTTAEDVTRKTLEDLEKTIRALFNESTMPTIWSRAAMIVLCQRLHRAGPLHPLVRAMSWDIILTLDPVPCHKSEVFPLFLAGTTALLETQRIAVTARWVRAPEKGFEEPLAFLKDLWEEMNKTGNTVSWMQFMEDRNVSLAFF